MQDRINRAFKHKMYLIDYIFDENIYTFKIEGSTGNIYNVLISNENLTCTCPDFKTRKVECKHIFFVVFRVFDLTLDNIYNKINLNYINNKINKKKESESDSDLELENNNCCICFEIVKDKINCIQCYGIYCTDCINRWLKHKGTCPCCRIDISKIKINETEESIFSKLKI